MANETWRRWLFIPLAGALGGVTYVLAQSVDAWSGGAPAGIQFALVPTWAAALAFAAVWLPPVRVVIAGQTSGRRLVSRSLLAVAVAFILFLLATLAAAPEISARGMLYFYALALVLDQALEAVDDRFGISAHVAPRASDGNAVGLTALFVLAGLVLLASVPVALLASAPLFAARVANWSYGFLVLGAAAALLRFLPARFKMQAYVPAGVSAALVIGLVLTGYALGRVGLSKAEATYITDVNTRYLSGRVRTGDLVLSDSAELNLDDFPRLFPSLNVRPDERGTALWDDLKRALQGKRRVYWVSVPQRSTDTQGILASFLKANGCLDDVPATALPVQVYELRSPLVTPQVLTPGMADRLPNAFDPVQIDYGAIQITGVKFESRVCSHDAVAVAVRWHVNQAVSEPLKVSLALFDPRGRQVQSQDFMILDGARQSTDGWKQNTTQSAYYLLSVPYGTIPGDYTLGIAVLSALTLERLPIRDSSVNVRGANFAVPGQVQIYRSNEVASDPYNTAADAGLLPAGVKFGDGIALDAYGVSTTESPPGTDLDITARWRALRDYPPAVTVRVALMQGDRAVAEQAAAPGDNTYPPDGWVTGEPVLDHWRLHIPPDAAGGDARLEIGIAGGEPLYLADIHIPTVPRTYTLPATALPMQATFAGVGDLAGYRFDGTIAARQRLGIDLYWRAGTREIEKDYVVFVQLLGADGRMIAQSDRAPAGGTRPTRGWLASEIIADHHELDLSGAGDLSGATLIVGLYDPETGRRVPITASPSDYVLLPGVP